MQYEYTPLYYNNPTRVRFYHPEHKEMKQGIALHDIVFDGWGHSFVIEQVITTAQREGVHFDDAIIELSWNRIFINL